MSLSASMNIGLGALNVNQAAINVVSNNIANMNTQGYSKQRAELENLKGYSAIANSAGKSNYIGNGVTIAKISSYRDIYMDRNFRTENSQYKLNETLYEYASNIETIMNEYKDGGIKNALEKFYDAAQSLASDPSNSVYRTNFATQAQNVGKMFNSLHSSLSEKRAEIVGDVNAPGSLASSMTGVAVDEVNEKLQSLADLNYKIIIAEAKGNGSASLRDERSRLLDEISSQIPTTVTENTNGTVNLYIGDMRLVKGAKLECTLEATVGDDTTPAVINILDDQGNVKFANVNDKIDGGQIGAYLKMGSSEPNTLSYANVISQLNQLASGFANDLNSIQKYTNGNMQAMKIEVDAATGELKLAQATEDLFVSSDGNPIDASNIKINDVILSNPNEIAAARVDITNYDEFEVGNSDNIKLMIEARDTNNANLNNTSVDKFLTSIVSNIGTKTANIKSDYEVNQSTKTVVENERQNKIGVNLDEELMDLIKYQTGYQAASRIFNITSELMMTLVNLGK